MKCHCSAFTLPTPKTQRVLTVGPGDQESHNRGWCAYIRRIPVVNTSDRQYISGLGAWPSLVSFERLGPT